VSGSTITASTSFGNSTVSWVIVTDSNTSFFKHNVSSPSINSIVVGDYVSFSGPINTSATALTVTATAVKDWGSATAMQKSLVGTVSSVDTANSRFTLAVNGTSVTVVANGSTKITRNGDSATLSSLAANDTVAVSGSYDSTTKVLTAEKISAGSKQTSNSGDKKHGWGFGRFHFSLGLK
jgi:hypothetical protein